LGESLNSAKDALSRAIESLSASHVAGASDVAMRQLVTRLQFARNALIENEGKIWLRTRAGKEMLSAYQESSNGLLRAVESEASIEEIEDALVDVESQAKRLNEETRRRSMVVT